MTERTQNFIVLLSAVTSNTLKIQIRSYLSPWSFSLTNALQSLIYRRHDTLISHPNVLLLMKECIQPLHEGCAACANMPTDVSTNQHPSAPFHVWRYSAQLHFVHSWTYSFSSDCGGRSALNITPSASKLIFQRTLTASAGWRGSKHASGLSGLILFIYKKKKKARWVILFNHAAADDDICYRDELMHEYTGMLFSQYLCRLWRWFRLRRLRDITLWETTVLHS